MTPKLIIGLGNIGSQYARTRHNIGFMAVDELARTMEATWRTEAKFKAEIAEATLGDQRIILAKPSTMMNLSGEAAQRLMQFYKTSPSDVWVVFDDVDVPFGRLRLRTHGGQGGGGHQGVRSLIAHIGPDFTRIRLGISLNDRTHEPSEIYVLKAFNGEEQPHLPQILSRTAAIIAEQLSVPATAETTFDLLA